eukprot:15859-Heterococcus_DN1.PRE.4
MATAQRALLLVGLIALEYVFSFMPAVNSPFAHALGVQRPGTYLPASKAQHDNCLQSAMSRVEPEIAGLPM